MKKRIISIVLALAMVLSLVPAVAFADYISPIDDAFEYSALMGYSQSEFDHAHDMDATLELGELGSYFLVALGDAFYYEAEENSTAFSAPAYILGARAAYHEAVGAIEFNPRLATYIVNVASLLPRAMGEALNAKYYGLAAYYMTTFQELVAEMKLYPDKAESISVLGYALLKAMSNYTDDFYNVTEPLTYAMAVHAAYLEIKAVVDNDPFNAYYLTGIGEWFIDAEADALAPFLEPEAPNHTLAAALFALYARIASDIKANPDDAKYLATLALYLIMYVEGSGDFVKTVESIAKLTAVYELIKATAKKYPELKKDIYYLGIYLFYSDKELDEDNNGVYTMDEAALTLEYIGEMALQFTEIVGLMVKYPQQADGIALAGGEMLYELSNLEIKENKNYLIQRTILKEAFLEILLSMGVNKKVLDEYSQHVENAHAALATYTDVELGAWYYEPINYCMERGAMDGISETEFGVNASMTNNEAVKAISKLANIYIPVIEKLNPSKELTREDLAVILYTCVKLTTPQWKINKVTENTNTLSYNDIFEVSEDASTAFHYCLAAGLIKGDANGNVFPGKTATKAEVATILYRFFN